MSAAVVSHVADFLGSAETSGPVSLFAARPDEPDLLSLLDRDSSASWVFPRVDRGSVVLHRVSAIEQLAPGRFGIREPAADAPVVAPRDVRVFLCPGVAFNRSGIRLGRGGGYYDRLLADRSRESLTIGVCCEAQIFEALPSEDHDIGMDLLITEKGVIRV
jgi:5-formyltetrahydrofolate cyclo-ligase